MPNVNLINATSKINHLKQQRLSITDSQLQIIINKRNK